jgi:hypothetical protein
MTVTSGSSSESPGDRNTPEVLSLGKEELNGSENTLYALEGLDGLLFNRGDTKDNIQDDVAAKVDPCRIVRVNGTMFAESIQNKILASASWIYRVRTKIVKLMFVFIACGLI